MSKQIRFLTFLGESKWINSLFSQSGLKINQRSVTLIFGAGIVPLLEKPGSWLVLAKYVESICGIVRFQVKMQVNSVCNF